MTRRILSLCLAGSLSAVAALPLRQVNNPPSGARIACRPLDLPADLKKDAKLTLVMVPESPDGFSGAKTGWDNKAGVAATELPRPVAGEGSKQTLRIAMPWPSPTPKAPLFLWLRGETDSRATKVGP